MSKRPTTGYSFSHAKNLTPPSRGLACGQPLTSNVRHPQESRRQSWSTSIPRAVACVAPSVIESPAHRARAAFVSAAVAGLQLVPHQLPGSVNLPQAPNLSIEGAATSKLRLLVAAPHVKR